MHQLLKVPDDDNPTSSMLTPFANMILQRSPLLAVGIVDEDGWPWTAVWGGEAGFAGALGPSMIGVVGQVDGRYDPVVKELMKGVERDGIVGQGRVEKMMVGGLAIDLMARKRVKLYGRMLTGKLVPDDENSKQHATGEEKAVLLQLAVRIEQSLGRYSLTLSGIDISHAADLRSRIYNRKLPQVSQSKAHYATYTVSEHYRHQSLPAKGAGA